MFDLPTELTEEIRGYLRHSDLASLSQCSRAWQLIAQPLLFRHIILKPRKEAPDFRDMNTALFQNTRSLTIRDKSVNGSSIPYLKPTNEMAARMLANMRDNHLVSFNWRSPLLIMDEVWNLVVEKHHGSLCYMEWHGIYHLVSIPTFPRLNTLKVWGLDYAGEATRSRESEKLRCFIKENARSLRTIAISHEETIFKDVYYSIHQVPNPLYTLLGEGSFAELRSLQLIGADLCYPMSLTPFKHLKKLALESCADVEAALIGLSECSDLQLKDFSLRQEIPSPTLYRVLAQFLNSFVGLTHLRLLLDSTSDCSGAERLITHQDSLQYLTWDHKVHYQNRKHNKEGAPHPSFANTLLEILRSHPWLRQIGCQIAPDRQLDSMNALASIKKLQMLCILPAKTVESSKLRQMATSVSNFYSYHIQLQWNIRTPQPSLRYVMIGNSAIIYGYGDSSRKVLPGEPPFPFAVKWKWNWESKWYPKVSRILLEPPGNYLTETKWFDCSDSWAMEE